MADGDNSGDQHCHLLLNANQKPDIFRSGKSNSDAA